MEAGISAPSGENCQPWRFMLDGNTICLYNDPNSDTSLYNHNQRGSLVSHGAAIENMIIAARTFGYEATIKLLPNGETDNLIAKISLQKNSPTKHALYDSIFKRATNRKVYDTKPTSQDIKNNLLGSATGDGMEAKFIDDKTTIGILAKIISNHERLLFENKFLHNFFFDHIRWNEKENSINPAGFYIETLELSPKEKKGFSILKRWVLARILGFVGMPKKVSEANATKYNASSELGIIYSDSVSSLSLINAGRSFERLWLTATKEGLSLQPLTGLLFLRQHVLSHNNSPLSEKEKKIIIDSYDEISKIFAVGEKQILLLFRIGIGEPPTAQASRFPLNKFLKY